jgi:hypothetical protein
MVGYKAFLPSRTKKVLFLLDGSAQRTGAIPLLAGGVLLLQ